MMRSPVPPLGPIFLDIGQLNVGCRTHITSGGPGRAGYPVNLYLYHLGPRGDSVVIHETAAWRLETHQIQ